MSIFIKGANGYRPIMGTSLSPITRDNMGEQNNPPFDTLRGKYTSEQYAEIQAAREHFVGENLRQLQSARMHWQMRHEEL